MCGSSFWFYALLCSNLRTAFSLQKKPPSAWDEGIMPRVTTQIPHGENRIPDALFAVNGATRSLLLLFRRKSSEANFPQSSGAALSIRSAHTAFSDG
jgi:hypothetical protein